MKPFFCQILTSALLLIFCVACESPLGLESQNPTAEPSLTPLEKEKTAEGLSSVAKKSKANSEIFHEMFVVVFMREPKDRSEFGNWVDTLNQGASLEGVYNGLTHSEDYRRLEKTSPKASEKAVKAFREEITLLEIELSIPTQLENFGLASLFTLKRVLSDEALKVLAAKNNVNKAALAVNGAVVPAANPSSAKNEESPRVKLAGWYSKWAVHMAQKNVDFGVALRNKPDEAFHFKWATEVSEDQIVWEVLNRLHRILNEANK